MAKQILVVAPESADRFQKLFQLSIQRMINAPEVIEKVIDESYEIEMAKDKDDFAIITLINEKAEKYTWSIERTATGAFVQFSISENYSEYHEALDDMVNDLVVIYLNDVASVIGG